MFSFDVLSLYVLTFLCFCFSMFCRSMFRHRSKMKSPLNCSDSEKKWLPVPVSCEKAAFFGSQKYFLEIREITSLEKAS